jgi:hypothetical protein
MQHNFQTGLEIHGLHPRSKNQVFVLIANLASAQKGNIYSGIKICNSLPSNILNLKVIRNNLKTSYTGIF